MKFSELRDRYKALAKGSFEVCASASSAQSIAAWYRSYDGQKVLVLHNFSAAPASVNLPSDNLTRLLGSNGTVTVKGQKLTLGTYASAVFLQ